MRREAKREAHDKLQRLRTSVQAALLSHRSWAQTVASEMQAALARTQHEQAASLKRGLQHWAAVTASERERALSAAGEEGRAGQQQLLETQKTLRMTQREVGELRSQHVRSLSRCASRRLCLH